MSPVRSARRPSRSTRRTTDWLLIASVLRRCPPECSTVTFAPSSMIRSPAARSRTRTPRSAARPASRAANPPSSSPAESQSSPTGSSSRTAKRPSAWSGCGCVSSSASRRVTPRSRSFGSTRVRPNSVASGSNGPPPSTRIALLFQRRSIASPCPTSRASNEKPRAGPGRPRADGHRQECRRRSGRRPPSQKRARQGRGDEQRSDGEDGRERRRRPQKRRTRRPLREPLEQTRPPTEERRQGPGGEAARMADEQCTAQGDERRRQRNRERRGQPGARRDDVEPPEENRRGRALGRECGREARTRATPAAKEAVPGSARRRAPIPQTAAKVSSVPTEKIVEGAPRNRTSAESPIACAAPIGRSRSRVARNVPTTRPARTAGGFAPPTRTKRSTEASSTRSRRLPSIPRAPRSASTRPASSTTCRPGDDEEVVQASAPVPSHHPAVELRGAAEEQRGQRPADVALVGRVGRLRGQRREERPVGPGQKREKRRAPPVDHPRALDREPEPRPRQRELPLGRGQLLRFEPAGQSDAVAPARHGLRPPSPPTRRP